MFSDWLVTAMKDRGVSQTDVAEVVGVSQAAVSRWCRGQTLPGGRHILGLAKALGVPIEELSGVLEATESLPPETSLAQEIAALRKRLAALERQARRQPPGRRSARGGGRS